MKLFGYGSIMYLRDFVVDVFAERYGVFMEEELKEEIKKELEEITDVWILEQIKKCIINIKKED